MARLRLLLGGLELRLKGGATTAGELARRHQGGDVLDQQTDLLCRRTARPEHRRRTARNRERAGAAGEGGGALRRVERDRLERMEPQRLAHEGGAHIGL